MKFIQSTIEELVHSLCRSRRTPSVDKSGSAAIEFAVLAPVFAIILAGGFDLALLIFSRFQLEASVSDGSSYILTSVDLVNSKSSSDLATKIASMIASEYTGADTQASVVVNNGAVADYNGSKIVIRGQVGQTDACYCPKGTVTSLDWGGSQTCGSSCPDGGQAGKYVTISVTQAFSPMFSSFGIVAGNSIHASAIVRTQ